MTDPMSPHAFKVLMTALTGGLGGAWFIYDSINLIRFRNLDRSDAIVRDRHFGYGMGVVIGAVGVIGCLLFWNVF